MLQDACRWNGSGGLSISIQHHTSPWASNLRRYAEHYWLSVGLIVVVLAGLGCFTREFSDLWLYWRANSVASIGMLAIPCAVVLTWLALHDRDAGWAGSWWGLAMIAGALALDAFAYPSPRLQLRLLGPAALIPLVPIGAMLWLYGSGIVVLFAGWRAWRRAFFPLAMLLAVQPIPPFIVSHFDLPLQSFDAGVARSFAVFLGIPVGGESLRLMFDHNRLGMLIVPGCDGFSGAVAMGYATLIAGYLYAVRPFTRTLYAIGAVLMAFALNLMRLCALVLFYWAAQAIPALGGYGAGADYIIGAVVFAAGAAIILLTPRWRLSHEG